MESGDLPIALFGLIAALVAVFFGVRAGRRRTSAKQSERRVEGEHRRLDAVADEGHAVVERTHERRQAEVEAAAESEADNAVSDLVNARDRARRRR